MTLILFLCRWLRIGLVTGLFVFSITAYSPNVYASTIHPLIVNSARDIQFQDNLLASSTLLPLELQIAQGGFFCHFFGFCQNRKKEDRPVAKTGEGGRNGRCSNLNDPLRALIPVLQSPGTSLKGELPENIINSIGFTISNTPTFWFYVPDLNINNQSPIDMGEFAIQDEQAKRDILNPPILLKLSNKPGIIGFTLPSSYGEKLQINRPYHWYFSIICDSRRPSRNLSVNGWIQRKYNDKKPELNRELQDDKEVEIYASQDLWYDTVTSMIRSRCNNSSNQKLTTYWFNFLKEVGLSKDRAIVLCPPKEKLQIAAKSESEAHY